MDLSAFHADQDRAQRIVPRRDCEGHPASYTPIRRATVVTAHPSPCASSSQEAILGKAWRC